MSDGTVENVKSPLLLDQYLQEKMPRRDPQDELNRSEFRDCLDRLVAACDPDEDEYNLFGSLAVKAGLMWRCIDPKCWGINHLNCARCDNCGRMKARKRATDNNKD